MSCRTRLPTNNASMPFAFSPSTPSRKPTRGTPAFRLAAPRWPTRCGPAIYASTRRSALVRSRPLHPLAGHGSALLYALLYLNGYALTLDDLKAFRQLGSKTPGHPEAEHTPGVEATTGPLGQGIGNAVGFAIAEAHLAAIYNRNDKPILDHCTYVIGGDGDLMEGVSQEASRSPVTWSWAISSFSTTTITFRSRARPMSPSPTMRCAL